MRRCEPVGSNPGFATLGGWFRKAVVVGAADSPSFDYYLAPRLPPGLEVQRRLLGSPPPRSGGDDFNDALVIVCRYADRAWIKALATASSRLTGVALFMDDDYAAIVADRTMPGHYRAKVRRLGLGAAERLGRTGAQFWVSTAALAEVWAPRPCRLLAPLAGGEDLQAKPHPQSGVVVAYHATASHAAERDWLEPVIRAVLARSTGIQFELVGDRAAMRHWRGDPRVMILPQAAWTDYRAQTAQTARTLLLAPLLATAANRARAAVKRIDACRCGAALLVSDPGVYEVAPAEQAAGMVAPLERRAWVEAIIALAESPERTARLAALNRAHVETRRQTAQPLIVPAAGVPAGWWTLS